MNKKFGKVKVKRIKSGIRQIYLRIVAMTKDSSMT